MNGKPEMQLGVRDLLWLLVFVVVLALLKNGLNHWFGKPVGNIARFAVIAALGCAYAFDRWRQYRNAKAGDGTAE